jgi:predicted dehydrogenase
MKIGLIGCGTISPTYLKAARRFEALDFVACADIDADAAARRGDEFHIPFMSVDDLLARDEIEIVLNLTVPKAHTEINARALAAGKHAYCEKPFGVDVVDGRAVLDLARERNLQVGCAPDTFLGGGHQTCRRLVDGGAIGRPVAATAFMMGHGHESWHPNPAFYYERGGGPLFDMGPYYLTALVNLLGPVRRVCASTGRGSQERIVTSEPRHGERVPVQVDTHVSGTLDFQNGTIVTLIMSFDVWFHGNGHIELHGTDGSLAVPDPNRFGGPVKLCEGSNRRWEEQPLSHAYVDNVRSIGLADMCAALEAGRDIRCSGERAFHVLEVMDALGRSSADGRHIEIESTCERPAMLPTGLADGELD